MIIYVSFVAGYSLSWLSESDVFSYLKFTFKIIITQGKHENKWKVLLLTIIQYFALLKQENLFLSNRIPLILNFFHIKWWIFLCEIYVINIFQNYQFTTIYCHFGLETICHLISSQVHSHKQETKHSPSHFNLIKIAPFTPSIADKCQRRDSSPELCAAKILFLRPQTTFQHSQGMKCFHSYFWLKIRKLIMIFQWGVRRVLWGYLARS